MEAEVEKTDKIKEARRKVDMLIVEVMKKVQQVVI